MKPAQALDRHGQLLEVLQTSEPARELVDIVAQSSFAGRPRSWDDPVQFAKWADGRPSDQRVVPVLVNHLKAAKTYHVAAGMVAVVEARADQLRGTQTFGEFPQPNPCGLAVLDEPLRWVEAGGRSELIHMISWGPGRFKRGELGEGMHGTIVVLWNDAHRDEDGVGRWLHYDDPTAWENTLRWTSGLMPTIVLAETADVRIGPEWMPVPPEVAEERRKDGLSPVEATRNPTRIVCALWQLLDETITVVEPDQPVERHFRKRAERRGIAPRVTVVKLRRTSEKGLEGSRGPLHERHDVSGHWRTYWVGSGEDRHKERRWIADHESPKNPNLPKRVRTEKVYSLQR